MNWKIVIDDASLNLLHRRFLGLTFFERRLREAKKWGVSCVYFIVPNSNLELPKVREKNCASWVVVHDENELSPDIRAHAYTVPLYGMIDSTPPFRLKLTVTSAADFKPARRYLSDEILRNSGTGWIGKKVNKAISLPISRRLAETPISANHWSFVNLAIGILAAYFVAEKSYLLVALGGVLFQLASIFDGVDGELAKFRLEESRFGAWLDTAVDNLSLLLFLGGVGVHLVNYSSLTEETLQFLLGVSMVSVPLFLGYICIFVFMRLKARSLTAMEKLYLNRLPEADPVIRTIKILKPMIKKDFFSFLFFGLACVDRLDVLMVIVAFGPIVALASVLYLNVQYGTVHAQPERQID